MLSCLQQLVLTAIVDNTWNMFIELENIKYSVNWATGNYFVNGDFKAKCVVNDSWFVSTSLSKFGGY